MLDRLELMKERLGELEHRDYPSNVSPDVRRGIQQLQKLKSVVIRQADKGSCTVIVDREQYISEGTLHLSDINIYTKNTEDRTVEIAHKSNWAINHYNTLGVISNYHRSQLITDVETVRTQQMYFLRKVHKHPHQLRPIVSASSGPIEKISGLITKYLGPCLDDIPSLVRNSLAVVNLLEGLDLLDQPDILLVSLDVKALYPSIPQGSGMEMAIQRAFPTTPPTSRQVPFKNMIRDLLKIVLGDNHFSFADNFYTQKSGVAMGTKCAPHLANLFMAAFEEKALASWKGTTPLQWLRFIDDVFMIWPGTREELNNFHNHLNSQMSTIEFTMEASEESATFLDLRIYKGARFRGLGILDTSLHIKETNPQCFLHYSSCHSLPTFSTVLRGEVIRALRCTSSPTVFTRFLTLLLHKFRDRGYPEWLIKQETSSINFSKRKELLHPPERRGLEADVTLFESIFTPGISSKAIRTALQDPETPFYPMVLRPRPTSIQDRLVRAKLPTTASRNKDEDTG